MESETPKNPEQNAFIKTMITIVVSGLIGFLVNQPFDKAKSYDQELIDRVNQHETRIQAVERFQDRSDEKMNGINSRLDKIEKKLEEMLVEVKNRK